MRLLAAATLTLLCIAAHAADAPIPRLLAPGVLFSPRQATSSKLRVPVAMADLVTPWKILESLLNQLRK